MSENDHASRIAAQLAMADEDPEPDSLYVSPNTLTVSGDRVPEKLAAIVGEDGETVGALEIAGGSDRIRVSACDGNVRIERVDGGE
jgi:hypothetical protein